MKNASAGVCLAVTVMMTAPAVLAAPLEVQSSSSDEDSFQVSWLWDTTAATGESDVPLSSWSVSLTAFSNAEQSVVNVFAQHLAALHPGEPEPGMPFTVAAQPGGRQRIAHNAHGDHWDSFSLSISAVQPDGKALIVLSGVHAVPEPGTWALFAAGLGVAGIGARLRMGRR